MTALPPSFLSRMQSMLGGDYAAFLKSYETPPVRGLRVNAHKIAREEFLRLSPFALEPVPWEENGFYFSGERAGADPMHFAGLYYLQEPTAMSVVPLLELQSGERVLDLCAAPGGKSTKIAELIGGEGLLIANEIEPSRAKVLAENVERLGFSNVAVVNASPDKICENFPFYFDKVLVDAPCSGEGMFKKEPQAASEWSEDNVTRCAIRQREILDCAAKCLRAGGVMVYSTCTFAPAENEDQIDAFLKRHGDFELVRMQRLLPHEVRGEGQFAAVLRRTDGERGKTRPFPVKRSAQGERAYHVFENGFLNAPVKGEITTLSDGRMYALPGNMPAVFCRLLRAGVELGEWDGRVFRPAHALVMSRKKSDFKRYTVLSEEEAIAYLSGAQLAAPKGTDTVGWCAVGTDFPLGLGKIVGENLKNYYPKGLRLRSAPNFVG